MRLISLSFPAAAAAVAAAASVAVAVAAAVGATFSTQRGGGLASSFFDLHHRGADEEEEVEIQFRAAFRSFLLLSLFPPSPHSSLQLLQHPKTQVHQ